MKNCFEKLNVWIYYGNFNSEQLEKISGLFLKLTFLYALMFISKKIYVKSPAFFDGEPRDFLKILPIYSTYKEI